MTNNYTKNTLLTLFADNVNGNITAETLRTFISSTFDTTEVIVNKFQSLSHFEAQANPTIWEGSLVVIYDSTPAENGLYRALINQPQDRQFLVQVSNNDKVESITRTPYEFIATEAQTLFYCEYSENFVDFYVNGKKLKQSELEYNSSVDANGTNVVIKNSTLLAGDEVEIICHTK